MRSQRYQLPTPQQWDKHKRIMIRLGIFVFFTFLIALAALVLGVIYPKQGNALPPTTTTSTTTAGTTTSAPMTTTPAPPVEELNCSDVQQCVNGTDLILNSLVVQNLTTIDHQEVFQVDNLFVNESLTCSSALQIGEGCPIISTVNTITPGIDKDFVIIGGNSVIVTGGMHSLKIDVNVTIIVPPEFGTMIEDGFFRFYKLNQTANTVYAAPANGVDGVPEFRPLVEADLPEISLESGVYGVLSVENGGTGNNVSYQGAQIIVSAPDGMSLIEGMLVGGDGINITSLGNGTFVLDVIAGNVVSVDLDVPTDIFQVTSVPVTYNGTLSFAAVPQGANLVWAGPATMGAPDAVPTFRPLVQADMPPFNLDEVEWTGVLPIDNGGTGTNGTSFVGGQVLFSTNTSIVEGTVTAGTGISVSITGTELTVSNTGVTSVSLAAPSDIFNVVNPTVTNVGTLEFVSKDQMARHVWAGPVGAGSSPDAPTFRLLDASDIPVLNASTALTGVLSVENGGTGVAGPYDANRVIFTNADGTQLIASNILNDGDIIIGSSGMAPKVGQITSPGGEIIVTAGSGSIELALGESISTTDLTVTGSTFLGNTTSCVNPLQPSCYDISNQECASGPLATNCLPGDVTFTTLVVTDLTVLNTTVLGDVISQDFLNITNLIAEDVTLNNQMTCSANATISQDCFEIAGKTCPSGMPVSESCIPASLIFYDLGVTNDLTVNNVTCNGGALNDACIPKRVKTISGIMPNPSTLDFDIQVGTGLALTTIANGISLSNTGVTSVGLAAPSDLFDVTVSPVTTTGTLTFVAKPQMQNTFWAGPTAGSDAVPTFRTLSVTDLPPLQPGEIYYGTNGETNLTSSGTIELDFTNGTLTIVGTGVSSVGMTVPAELLQVTGSPITSSGSLDVSLSEQGANTILAGPSASGAPDATPTFRPLVFEDLPTIPLVAGPGIAISGLNISNTGVTSVGLTSPAVVFEVSNSPITSTGNIVLELLDQAAHTVFAGPLAGGPDAPSFRMLDFSDLAAFTNGTLLGSNGTQVVEATLVGSGAITVTSVGGVHTISTSALTSVGLNVPSAEFTIANSPLTADGTLVIGKQPQAQNLVWAGPVSGADAEPTFRGLNVADLTSLGLADGQLIVGSTGGAPVATNLMAGSNVVITNSPGGILISASVNETAIGTVTSVGMSVPGALLDLSGTNPITSSGTFAVGLVNQSANTVFAGPSAAGPDGQPVFRALTVGDLPALGENAIYLGPTGGGAPVTSTLTAGTGVTINTSGGLTTFSISALVSSVGLDITGPLYTVSNSPVTTSGTLTATLNTQAEKTFFAGPTSGANAAPTFRAMALSDLPPLANGEIYIGQMGTPVASGLSAGSGVTIAPGPGTIVISATGSTGSNVGTAGVGVFKQVVAMDLQFKKLYTADASLSIVDDVANDRITFSVNDAQIDHDALFNFVSAEHVDHSTVSILGGEGIQGGGDLTATRTLALDVNSLAADASPAVSNYLLEYDVVSGTHKKVLISDLPSTGGGSGEANTASNVGVNGVGVFLQKTGVDLEFKRLHSPLQTINITDDTTHVLLDVNASAVDHDALLNYIVNEHIDHSSVSVTGGIGLAGGGDLTVNRVLDLDINSLTEDASPTNSDFLLEYDVSTGTHKKVLISSLPYAEETMSNIGTAGIGVYKQKTGSNFELKKLYSSDVLINIVDDIANDRITFSLDQSWVDHDLLMHYEAAEHVNHSAVSIVAGEGLSGGGTIEASRTLALDVDSLTADGSPALSDFLLSYDVSSGSHKKVLISSLPFGAGDFSNGGDVAGAHRTLGNTDAFDLALLTNAQDRLKLYANGQVTIGGGVPQTNYKLTVDSPTASNGVTIRAGDNVGDIALSMYDQDESTMILQVESNGYVTLGKTYAQTNTDHGVVYGMDNQNALANLADFNTQHGGYRIAGTLLNINHLQDVDTATSPPTTNDVLKWDGSNWVPSDMAGLEWKGPWLLSTVYALNDVVSHAGSSYVCILGHTSDAPSEPDNGTYWQLVAQKGDEGAQGPQGVQGVQGLQGVQGIQGPIGLNWEGPWLLSTAYAVDDAVSHVGRSYICIFAHTSDATNEPQVGTSWTSNWQVLAEKGATGSGSTITVNAGGPFSELNFAGTGISTVDSGGGVATMTVNAPIFGQNFQTAQVVTTDVSTTTAWVQRQRLTTPSLPSGTYRIEFTTIHSTMSSSVTLGVRLQINDTTTLFGGNVFARENQDSSPAQRETYSGTDYYTGSGVLNIDLDFSRFEGNGNSDVYMYFSSVTIWRVA